MTIFYIALAVVAIALIIWLLRLFVDGRRLRRERRAWLQELTRQEALFRERP